MAGIASKNLFDLLGNDPELDPDREPEPPTQVADKPVERAGKRNAGGERPPRDPQAAPRGGRGGRNDAFTGSEGAFRDRNAGAVNNRARAPDDGLRQDRHPDRLREPGERGRGRGDRGGRGFGGRGRGRGGGGRDDRHNHSGVGEHEKQAAHGWGAETGPAELADEKAGEAIAKEEEKDEAITPDTAVVDGAVNNTTGASEPVGDEAAAAAEAEDKTMSYDAYKAQQAEKRLALSESALEIRKPNEGSKQKFPEGKAIERTEDENFIVGSGGKQRREKERKTKEQLQLEGQYYKAEEQDRGGFRGGRGGARGGRGRGDGDRPFRGESRGGRGGGRGRGDFVPRGGRGGGGGGGGGNLGGGGGERGGRGGGPAFNALSDNTAFPALGGS